MAYENEALFHTMDGVSPNPRASSSPEREILTPRSKVARMLAEIDNAPTPPPGKQHTGAASSSDIQHSMTMDQSKELSQSTQNKARSTMLFESDDESDEDVRRPVGRAARRMHAGAESPPRSLQLLRSNTSSPLSRSRSAVHRRDTRSDEEHEHNLYFNSPISERRAVASSSTPLAAVRRSDLFVSPARSLDHSNEDELPDLPLINRGRFAELVAQKRSERLAKESAEDERIRSQKSVSQPVSSDLPEEMLEDSLGDQNPEIDRIMSDAAKPTRKASKKAMLEMQRETQRLARQQALTHDMKVRKRFTTSSLFERFNFHPLGLQGPPPQNDGDGNTTASSAPNSDGFDIIPREPVSTPPSSPPTPLDRQRALVDQGALSKLVPVREDSLASLTDLDTQAFPDISTVLNQSVERGASDEATRARERELKLARLGKKPVIYETNDSSDDELEIVQDLEDQLNIFDKAKKGYKVGSADCQAIHALKHLAHIGADAAQPRGGRKLHSRPTMHPAVLEAQLRARAKEQARAQQLERIAELKAKGINVQTSEEREREAEEFENLLEKAREDAIALRKAEKVAAKEDGQGDASDDESEDNDYEYSGDEDDDSKSRTIDDQELVDVAAEETDEDDEELEYDSDEEEVDNGNDAGNDDVQTTAEQINQKSDVEIAQADSNVAQDAALLSSSRPDLDEGMLRPLLNVRRPRNPRIIMEDEDSDEELSQSTPTRQGQAADDNEQDPFAAFNFGMQPNGLALMSPTQAFNATMQTPTQLTQEDSMDILRQLVPPSVSLAPSYPMHSEDQREPASQTTVVANSQVPDSQKISLAWETQPPETPVPALRRGSSAVDVETPGWEPSQDVGLPSSWQAAKFLQRGHPADSVTAHETQSTVRLRISESPAPATGALRRRRLVRRQGAISDSSDEDETDAKVPTERQSKDAFREMARKRKEALTAAELADAQREMKGMMDEQAEESEDEYAGLGGDDYIAPETEEDREMIDSSHVDVDERAIAAHFAERQRIADEAEASKLYNDLMTGALRRKQANMFDLGEDEDDLAVRRRQMRQREEARKRRLLLQDNNIAGLAKGKSSKGKDAFLRAIADDDDDVDNDDNDLLDGSYNAEDAEGLLTQAESQPSQRGDDSTAPLREVSGNKRRLEEDITERAPAKQRRTNASTLRAPTSLLEVKESVSFLLDEADNTLFGPSVLEINSDSEDQDESGSVADESEDEVAAETARQNDGGFAPDPIAQMPPPRLPASQRRTAMKTSVVDRLLLKRGSSTSDGAASRTAWGPAANGSFKTPSLLRRATVNVAVGANERGVTTSNSVSRENSSVKIGGSKKSSLAYQARAEERKALVEASVRRRAENSAKVAQLRRGSSSLLASGLAGRFE